VFGGCPEAKDEYQKPKQADCSVSTIVARRLLSGECSNDNDSNCTCSAEWQPDFLRNQLNGFVDGIAPYKCNRLREVFGGDVVGYVPSSKNKPEERRFEPSQTAMAVVDECSNPPSVKGLASAHLRIFSCFSAILILIEGA